MTQKRKLALLAGLALVLIFAILGVFTNQNLSRLFQTLTFICGFACLGLYFNAALRSQNRYIKNNSVIVQKELSRLKYHSEKNRATAGSVNKLRNGLEEISASIDNLQDSVMDEKNESINKIDSSLSSTHLFPINKTPLVIDIEDLAEAKKMVFTLKFEAEKTSHLAKAGIVACRFFSAEDKEISHIPSLKVSPEYGPYFYIDLNRSLSSKNEILVPKNAVRLQMKLLSWAAPEESVEIKNGFQLEKTGATLEKVTPKVLTDPILQKSAPPTEKKIKDLNVVMICDEFTFNSFSPEFNAIPILPENWKDEFEKNEIDFFFCESAWSGVDSVGRPWKGRIYSSENFTQENRTHLLAILDYCKAHEIPTVFWNKEDPSHYYDKVHNFTSTAQYFDHVFTSDVNCVELYKKDFGLNSVHSLAFAAQPKIYNPAGSFSRNNEVLFAGSWYENHKDRSVVMNKIMGELVDQNYDLKIYDRFFGTEDQNHIFPDRFQPYLHPSISHTELAKKYKEHQFGLNFNTVTDSSTMFARRIFELAASNVTVISNWSKGAEEIFGESVIFPDKDPQVLATLKTQDPTELSHKALNITLQEHTYTHRVIEIVKVLGLDVELPTNELTLVQLLRHEDELGVLQRQVNSLGSLVTNHTIVLGKDLEPTKVSSLYNQLNRFGTSVVQQPFGRYAHERAAISFNTENVLLTDSRSSLDARALNEAVPHLSYSDAPISAGIYERQYRYVTKSNLFGTILPSDVAVSAIANPTPKPSLVYTI